MSTLQKQIRTAIAANIQAGTGLAPLMSPRCDVATLDLPAVCIFSHGDKPQDEEEDHQKAHHRIYTVAVDVSAEGRPEEDATDDLAVKVRQAVLSDDSLGGLVDRVIWADQIWAGVEGETPMAGTVLTFNCFYLWRPE